MEVPQSSCKLTSPILLKLACQFWSSQFPMPIVFGGGIYTPLLPYWQVVGAFHVLTISEGSRALSNLQFVGFL
jgi:hypothetical protein